MDSVLSGTAVSVHLHVADTTVEFHTEHDGNRLSLRVKGEDAGRWNTPATYLTGTPDELIAFARRIMQAVVAMPVEVKV